MFKEEIAKRVDCSKHSGFFFEQSLAVFKGVGPKLQEKLAKCGLVTYRDALFYFPFRYEDRTRLTPIKDCNPGAFVQVQGKIIRSMFNRKLLTVDIQDQSGVLSLVFFHFNHHQARGFKLGTILRCCGEVKLNRRNLTLAHPEYYVIDPERPKPVEERLTPIYPSTEGLYQPLLRKIILGVLEAFNHSDKTSELLPPTLNTAFLSQDFLTALNTLHQPTPDIEQSRLLERTHILAQRLIYEEIWTHQLLLKDLKHQVVAKKAISIPHNQVIENKLLNTLPFKLTKAQRRVVDEIKQNLNQSHPMMRLVQGDVGSGKTIVAALAALQVLDAGLQVAVMAPTEILAEQHYRAFCHWFHPVGFQCVWLSGKMKAKEKKAALEELSQDKPLVAIGTHALFQESVQFNKLALMIVDEQHRFGVLQRLALMEKGKTYQPHQLVMTATPIPRTLAMTRYAHLDLSVVDELPPGRKLIKTVAISDTRRQDVIDRIRKVVASKQQVYWVCTLIEESEILQCQTAEASCDLLQKECEDARIGLVHGKLPSNEKEAVMADFKAGNIDILVATTVIEVGVDVPNASLMVIENAERLGLSQLHQLRGRVGRGGHQSYCVLLFKSPLTDTGRARLDILRHSQDGFVIAEEDLVLRGAGEVLGTRQTGAVSFRLADIIRDRAIVEECYKILINDDIDMSLKNNLIERWVGERQEFSGV